MRGTQKLWTLCGVAVVLLIAVVGWLMFISPANDQISKAQSQNSDVQTHNAVLQARLNQLADESKHLATYENSLAKAQAALPASDGLANFLRELQNLGSSTLVTVTQLAVNAPVAAQSAAPTSPSATPSTAAAGASTTPMASAYSIPIVITATGTVPHLNQFLDQLQEVQPRAVLITQASLGTGPQSTVVGSTAAQTTLQLTMNAFVAPMGAAAPSVTPTTSTSPSGG